MQLKHKVIYISTVFIATILLLGFTLEVQDVKHEKRMMKACPMMVEGSSAAYFETADGASIAFTTTGDVDELRGMVERMAKKHTMEPGDHSRNMNKMGHMKNADGDKSDDEKADGNKAGMKRGCCKKASKEKLHQHGMEGDNDSSQMNHEQNKASQETGSGESSHDHAKMLENDEKKKMMKMAGSDSKKQDCTDECSGMNKKMGMQAMMKADMAVEDIPDGARLSFAATDSEELETLRSQVRDAVERMNTGGCMNRADSDRHSGMMESGKDEGQDHKKHH